jgi:uncharacterized protein (DUF1697 family)
MGRQIALLRGINVGKAKRIGMADLRAVFEGLGHTDVRTLLNSGNVVFTSPRTTRGNPAARIEKEIAARLGVSSRVTVLTAAELEAAVHGNPFGKRADNPSRFLIAVLNDPADLPRLKALARQDWGAEGLALGTRVAYLWCPNGILESPLATALGRELRDAVTSRNWTTMTKLLALAGGNT